MINGDYTSGGAQVSPDLVQQRVDEAFIETRRDDADRQGGSIDGGGSGRVTTHGETGHRKPDCARLQNKKLG